MREPCDICHDRKVVTLAVYRRSSPVVRVELDSPAIGALPASRDYPCPACSPSIDHDHVMVAESRVVALTRHKEDQRYQVDLQRQAAASLAVFLCDHGFITFEWGEPLLVPGERVPTEIPLVARLGVVTREVVATISERVSDNQEKLAGEVAEEAVKNVGIWGRDLGWVSMSKQKAAEMINAALATVLKRHRRG